MSTAPRTAPAELAAGGAGAPLAPSPPSPSRARCLWTPLSLRGPREPEPLASGQRLAPRRMARRRPGVVLSQPYKSLPAALREKEHTGGASGGAGCWGLVPGVPPRPEAEHHPQVSPPQRRDTRMDQSSHSTAARAQIHRPPPRDLSKHPSAPRRVTQGWGGLGTAPAATRAGASGQGDVWGTGGLAAGATPQA